MAIQKTMRQLRCVRGHATRNIEAAVYAAKRTGYVIGRRVRIGVVTGVSWGYNIARCGDFEAVASVAGADRFRSRQMRRYGVASELTEV
jgi:hypothetical protein